MHFEIVPPTVVFAGNPIRYRIHLVDGGGPPPGKSLIEIVFSGKDTHEDHAVTLAFLGVERTFSLKSSPDDAYSIPSATSDETVENWAYRFYTELQKNGELLKNYQILLSDDSLTINLRAYENGSSFDMSVVSNTIEGLTINASTGGSGSTSYDGGAVMVLDKDGILLGEDIKPINDTNFIDYEISEYLHAQFAVLAPPRFILEDSTHGYIYLYVDLVKKYRVLAGYHIPGLVYVSLYDNYHWAIFGGLSREGLMVWNQVSGGFWNDANNKKRFLTWGPPVKKTSRTNHESLYFFTQYSDVTRYNVKVKAYLADKSSTTFELTHMIYSAQYVVLEMMVGYGQMDIESHTDNQPVVKWDVWVEDQLSRILSEVRTFLVDEKVYEFPREFVFRNSFAVYDYIRFTGKIEKNLVHDRETTQIDRNEVETFYNTPEWQTKILEQQIYKGSSGWVSHKTMDVLRDMMLSPEVYEIVNEKPLRISITTKKTSKYLKDGEYLYNLDIEYQRAYQDNFYSNIEEHSAPDPIPDPDPDPMSWDSEEVTFDSEEVTFDQTLKL